jgi:hypothetical protein
MNFFSERQRDRDRERDREREMEREMERERWRERDGETERETHTGRERKRLPHGGRRELPAVEEDVRRCSLGR